ncbi:MAG: helix-turn-helix domain-containing protein, partial [Thermoproteota archaeon]
MSTLNEERAAEVVKALGSDVRLKILKELEKEPSRYNELMKRLKLDRRSDAGNFAFHLNKLLDAKLVELDKIEKKYKLTPLGNVALEYYRMLSDSSLGMEIMPDVRRSDMRIEKFDRQKIERSLIEEAGMERSLASKISIEVQNRLLSSNVRMLTAPLIREFVNAILI